MEGWGFPRGGLGWGAFKLATERSQWRQGSQGVKCVHVNACVFPESLQGEMVKSQVTWSHLITLIGMLSFCQLQF